MRALLIALVVGLTGLTFYFAQKQTSEEASAIEEQQVAMAERLAQAESAANADAELQEQKIALEADVNTLNQSVQTLTSERDGLAGELAQVQAAVEAKDDELEAISGQNATLQQNADTAATRIAELIATAEAAVSSDEVEKLQTQLTERDGTVTCLLYTSPSPRD